MSSTWYFPAEEKVEVKVADTYTTTTTLQIQVESNSNSNKLTSKFFWSCLCLFLSLAGGLVLFHQFQILQPSSNHSNLSYNGDAQEILKAPQFSRRMASGDMALSVRIRGSMNTTENPCTDFNEFTCGNYWKNDLPVPSLGSSWDQPLVDEDSLAVHAWARALLEEPVTKKDWWGLTQAKRFYAACVQQKEDLKAQENAIIVIDYNYLEASDSYVSKLISNIRRKYNARNGNEAMRTPAIMGSLRRHFGIKLGFKSTVFLDGLGITRPNETANLIHVIMIESLTSNDDTLPWEVEGYVSYEPGTQNGSLVAYSLEDTFDLLYPITDTEKNITFNERRRAQWGVFLSNLLGTEESEIEIYMNPNELDSIKDSCSYFDKAISKEESVTMVKDLSIKCQKYMESTDLTVSVELTGMNSRTSRSHPTSKINSRLCVKGTTNAFPYIIANQYLKQFGPEFELEVEGIFQNIRKAFKQRVDASKLWTSSVKSFAKEKADVMRILIGSPSWLRNQTAVQAKYKYISLKPSWSYEKMMLEILVAKVHMTLEERLENIPDVNEFVETWQTNPMATNAYYHLTQNIIEIPAGYLHYPYFGYSRKYLTYGALGSTVGHELTHGFGITGRLRGSNGSKFNWWDEASNATYETQTECFVESLSNYNLPSFSKNDGGRRTLGETIADHGGIALAAHAYQNYVSENGHEFPLPGLENYTPEQLFFIIWAQTACDPTSQAEFELDKWPYSHPPNEITIREIMDHSSAFRSAWNCPTDENEKRCEIW